MRVTYNGSEPKQHPSHSAHQSGSACKSIKYRLFIIFHHLCNPSFVDLFVCHALLRCTRDQDKQLDDLAINIGLVVRRILCGCRPEIMLACAC